jgi:hypothetical protein
MIKKREKKCTQPTATTGANTPTSTFSGYFSPPWYNTPRFDATLFSFKKKKKKKLS